MNEKKKNLVVTLADNNFISQAKQLFSSIYLNSGWEGDYLLLTNNITKEDEKYFTGRGILVYKCDNISDSEVGISKHPPIVLAKFSLFNEYFKKWNKIIFLDADIMVKASLQNLLTLDGFNAPQAPSVNIDLLKIGDFVSLKEEFENIDNNLYTELSNKYDLKAEAFNTGVLVFDTSLIETKTYSDILYLYEKYGTLNAFGEEGTLNLYFYKKWNKIPYIYNTLPMIMKIIYCLKPYKFESIIIHFIATIKPWRRSSKYNKEWKNNLIKFDNIDLTKRPEAVKVWTEKEINEYLIYLKNRHTNNMFYINLMLNINSLISQMKELMWPILLKIKKLILSKNA